VTLSQRMSSVTAKSFAASSDGSEPPSLAMALRALVRQTTRAKPKLALQWWLPVDARRAYPRFFPTALFTLDEGARSTPYTGFRPHFPFLMGNQYLAPEPLKDVWRYVPPGSTVLEMGARYGTVSCAISRRQHNSGLRVSLEPSPSAYQILYRNTRANGCEGLNIHGVVAQRQVFNSSGNHNNQMIVNVGRDSHEVLHAVPRYNVSGLATLLSKRMGRPISFDTLVLDCENCTRTLLHEEASFFADQRLKTIVYDADERSPELILHICTLGFGLVSNQLDCLYPRWNLTQLVFVRSAGLPCPVTTDGSSAKVVATCIVDRAPVVATRTTCPSTLSIGRMMFNTNDFSWFKQNFPRHDFALLWHELPPNEHTRNMTQNIAFFPGLMRAWDKLGYEGFYDNSNAFFKKLISAVRIRHEHFVNMSWMVARAVRLLQPLTFVLAVNITLARIREYNKWQPLSVHAKIIPPVLNIFCAVEMVAIDAAVPVHIIHSEALLRVCEADGPVACVEHIAQQRRLGTYALTLQDMCGAVDVAVVSRQKTHPRHVCSDA